MSLTEKQLNELKNDLWALKDRLEQQEKETPEDSVQNDSGELSVVDNHLADSASGFVNREKQMAEQSLQERELREVNDALERMEEGTYGICVDTGEEIPFERLKAVPYAKRTVTAEKEYAKQSQGSEPPDNGETSRFEDADEETEDTKARTMERIESEHNTLEKPDDQAKFEEENKW